MYVYDKKTYKAGTFRAMFQYGLPTMCIETNYKFKLLTMLIINLILTTELVRSERYFSTDWIIKYLNIQLYQRR